MADKLVVVAALCKSKVKNYQKQKQKKKRAESLQVKENFKKIFHLSEAYPRCYRARRRGTLWTVCQPGRANTERHNHLYLQPMKDHQLN